MFLVDLNMMCSNRWAKPLRLGGSFFDPTLYQTWTAVVGLEASCNVTTRRPLGSVRSLLSSGATLTCAETIFENMIHAAKTGSIFFITLDGERIYDNPRR